MASNDNTARKPAMFGNFDIQETIGQGGMGVVYRAHDVTLNRDVALKVLKDELRENSRVVARFRREAEAIASLDHPRIVQVYSVGAVGNIPYFAMEYIEGKPLHRILRRHKFLQWKPALRIARDVAEALAAAHEAGIIHRDIKPGNILVDRAGHAYVSDFGIAKVLTAETQLTVDGSKLGTPQYMSPERVQNHEVTIESDIYSLGVVLFQMLTGRLPYDAQDPVELIRMIVIEPPRRVREFKPELSEDIERLVAYMIEKKPHDRPGTAGQVVELINRLLDGKPLFESDSGIDDALEDLREEISTPYSDSTMDLDSKSGSLGSTARRWIAEQWSAFPEWAKVLILAAPVAVLAYMLGDVYVAVGGRDMASEVVQSFSTNQSRWYQQGQLARFTSERSGAVVVDLLLDGYRAHDFGWASSDTAYVEVVDAGLGALCKVDPASENVSFIVPAGDWRPLDSLVTYMDDSGIGVIARPRYEGESDLFLAQIGVGGETLDTAPLAERVTETVAHPDGRHVLLSRREGRTGRVVEEWTLDTTNPRPEVLFTSQKPIGGLGYSAGGGLVFQEQTQTGLETNVFLPGQGRRRLTLGEVHLPSRSLNAEGDRLIALEGSGRGTEGVLFDAETGARLLDLGPMIDAAWSADERIAILAPDSDGAIQAWRIDTDGSGYREQLTSIDGGVEPRLEVRSIDGAVLVAQAGASPPVIAIVEP